VNSGHARIFRLSPTAIIVLLRWYLSSWRVALVERLAASERRTLSLDESHSRVSAGRSTRMNPARPERTSRPTSRRNRRPHFAAETAAAAKRNSPFGIGIFAASASSAFAMLAWLGISDVVTALKPRSRPTTTIRSTARHRRRPLAFRIGQGRPRSRTNQSGRPPCDAQHLRPLMPSMEEEMIQGDG